MRALLVHAQTPVTYWGYQHSLRLTGRACTLPPLGLISLAALLPASWELRLIDLNVEPLTDADLAWSEVVLVGGMLVQELSMHEVIAQARRAGKRVVAGGPAPTTSPDAFLDADHVFCGEAEGKIHRLVRALEQPTSTAPHVLSAWEQGDIATIAPEPRPVMALAPTPRFDLLRAGKYVSLSLQFSRGCPFNCEFCDIIEVFGRVPRTKSPEQVLAELDAVYATGFRGPLFFVDDNFIGNRHAVASLLPVIERWQAAHGAPFELYTEASMNLASMPELLKAMVDAGFRSVFVGIETPSPAALLQTQKTQNLRMPPTEVVETLTRAGLEVYAGFIVGFDADGPEVFALQREFISSVPIAMAMVGILSALPSTQLGRRLEKEGRLRGRPSGDQFQRPNFTPTMDEAVLVAGYRDLLADLFSPANYYARCARLIRTLGPTRARPPDANGIATFFRASWALGVKGRDRGYYWRLIWTALRHARGNIARAVVAAVLGEHLIRYTREDVIPRLNDALRAIEGERAARGAASSNVDGAVPLDAMPLPKPDVPGHEPALEVVAT
ncbi:MAG: B12-binding domain-containing radical SAM protein [Deltaproteobacteria bacterium]|nr:B12-binding domain-containing radical SAM protein [Deltaproteobacteria bacterium]